jgi:hypothetical protein
MKRTLRKPLAALGTVSLGVTMLRFCGELWGGPEFLFGRDAGGGGALVGIGWLIPVAGAWFGHRLARAGARPQPRAASTLGAGLLGVGVVFAAAKLLLPVTVATFLLVAGTLPLLSVCAFLAWPELARALLAFAVVQRLPVLAITSMAVVEVCGTHYEKLAPGSPPMGDAARTLVLCAAQLCLWFPLTLLIGGFTGVLAARRVLTARVSSARSSP